MANTMADQQSQSRQSSGLPEALRPLFWDHDFDALSWDQHRDFIIGRTLAAGTWESIRWLRARIGDQGVRDWILRHAGRGLTPQQLRFWELILGLPKQEVDAWLAREQRQVWDRRTGTSCLCRPKG